MNHRKQNPFADKLGKLADHIAEELLSAGNSYGFQQRLDGFKALTTYWATTEKVAAKAPPEEPEDALSFEKWSKKLIGDKDENQPTN